MSEKIIIASRAAGFAYAVLALVGGKSNRDNEHAKTAQFANPDLRNEEVLQMNFLCKLLIWSFLCCLLATRVQTQETERGGGT